MIGHTAAMRVYWLCAVVGEPGIETTPFWDGTEAIDWAERAIGEADRAGAKAVLVQALIERATAMSEVPERRADGIAALARQPAHGAHEQLP